MLLATPASADTIKLGRCEVAWAPASGPVARYAVERSDGLAIGLTAQTSMPLAARTWPRPLAVIVRALDAHGNLGPPSEPSEWFMCAANSPDLNGDGAVDYLDLSTMQAGLAGAEVRP
jgi:hypothetical protein